MIVEGVLESSPGGAGVGNKWSLIVHLMPWTTVPPRAAAKELLRIEVPMAERALEQWMRKLKVGNTVRVSVDRIRKMGRGLDWWFGVAKRPPTKLRSSKLLAAATAARAKTIVVKDARLGRLRLERSQSSYLGRVALWGRKVGVEVAQSGSSDDPARDARDIARASKAFAKLGRKAIDEAIVKKMLPLYNDNWRDTRPAISWVQLLHRIRPESVMFGSSRTTIYFKDGGLFLGHAIEVRIGKSGKVSEVCLAG